MFRRTTPRSPRSDLARPYAALQRVAVSTRRIFGYDFIRIRNVYCVVSCRLGLLFASLLRRGFFFPCFLNGFGDQNLVFLSIGKGTEKAKMEVRQKRAERIRTRGGAGKDVPAQHSSSSFRGTIPLFPVGGNALPAGEAGIVCADKMNAG